MLKLPCEKIVVLMLILLGSPLLCGADQQEILSLNLSQTVSLALERSYDLKNSKLDVALSESSNRTTLDTYTPRLTLSSDSEYSDPAETDRSDATLDHTFNATVSQTIMATGGSFSLYSHLNRYDDATETLTAQGYVAEKYRNTMGVTLDQPLLNGFGAWDDRLDVTKARLTLANAYHDYTLSERQLVLDTIRAYFSALKQQKLVEVGEKSVQDAQRHLDNTRIKLEEGLVALMDVSQAELQLARQQTSLIRTSQYAETTMDNLKLILALPLDTTLELTETVTNLSETLDASKLVSEALHNRLEIQQLQNQVKQAELSVSQAMNSRLPNLDLIVNAEVTHSDTALGDVFDVDQEDYTVSMGFSWTLGNNSSRESWVQDKIRLKMLENQLADRKQMIQKEVLDEVRNYRALVEALNVSDQSVKIAERALELATTSYSEGLTSNLDLIKAQDDLIEARNGYFSDLMDLAVSKARLINVIGRNIDPENLVVTHEK